MKKIISFSVLLVGLVAGLGASPAVAAQGSLAGTWTSTDTDGSNQTLTITASGRRVYAMSLYDDAASLCGGAPASASGSGSVEGGTLLMHAAAVCLPGGNVLRGVIDIGFTQASDDTLIDDFGVVWSRA